ncbi:MAG: phosphate signaling complex protein PhoU [Clostridiales Family XIII bacterium]|nr:phosphate signaling complex protein PhoU [Clostridiales Family XIII bacterium]
MRELFDRQLARLNNNLIEMGGLIEQAIRNATEALMSQDAVLAKEVIESEGEIDEKEKEIETMCLKLMLSQQPVASDFRQISTALKMITDMERIGDQASDIAELCILLSGQSYIKQLDQIPNMAEETIRMVTGSIDAFVRRDIALANDIIGRDDIVDGLFDIIKQDLISLVHEDANKGEQAFDLLQIAKYYERIGDHAVNIAEWVIFGHTGMHKDKRVL